MDAVDRKSAPGAPSAPIVDGIVVAAGRSSRMGRPKAALELDGRTFLQRCVSLLRDGGCRAIVVVVAAGDAPDLPAEVVQAVNPDPGSQQIDSIRIGLDWLAADAEAALVLPVDAPAVRPETVRHLIEAFTGSGASVVRPVYEGRPGHPALFARSAFAELAGADLPRGAETVVDRHAADRRDVAVSDPGVVANVNTPADYTRLQESS